MKILHVNCNYIGSELHQLMIENLDMLGYENKIFVPTYDKNIAVIVPNDNVCVSECFSKWDRLIFDYKQRKIIESVQSNFNVKEFQCIHAYTLFTDGNCARKLFQKYNIPYVVAVRNTDVNDFFRLMPHLRKRGVQIMRDATAVFFLSEAYRGQVFEKYVPKIYHKEIGEKTYIIPNGIDNFWFDNLPNKNNSISGEIKLIYAGRIDKNKNIAATQEAMRLLREDGYKISLTVIGKVMDKTEFERLKKDVYTTFISAKPKEELIKEYRNHDIFVMPSRRESFGLVYAEAMSQGLPVVYSAGQGFDKQFQEGQAGFSARSDSAESVAEAIIKIIDNYKQLADNVTELAKKFKWDEIVYRYHEIYEKIAGDCK